MTNEQRPDKEGFGEASLGEAQSSNPPSDPEMIRDEESPAAGEGGAGGEDTEGFKREMEEDPARAPEDEGLRRIQGG